MKLNTAQLPILYSLRNCPFAIRARMAIYYAQQPIVLRDVVLSDKPNAMLTASPKGTVPVLVLTSPEASVIEESIEVMLWALSSTDPDDFLRQSQPEVLAKMMSMISTFDNEFKRLLEEYKCAKRYHETNISECRNRCETYIKDLEEKLSTHQFLMSDKPSLVDIALLPFIRQFSRVERQWYLQSPYPNLRRWLDHFLQSRMFSKVMTKHPIWSPNSDQENIVIFGQK